MKSLYSDTHRANANERRANIRSGRSVGWLGFLFVLVIFHFIETLKRPQQIDQPTEQTSYDDNQYTHAKWIAIEADTGVAIVVVRIGIDSIARTLSYFAASV